MATKETMEDVRSTCECAGIKYCPYQKLIEGMADRVMQQCKCIDVLKQQASKLAGKDIGWDKACELWAEEGYAKAFAEVWAEGLTHRQLCKAIKAKLKEDVCL